MSCQGDTHFETKAKKNTTTAILEKLRKEKPFVQVEGELTEEQLEAIALWRCTAERILK